MKLLGSLCAISFGTCLIAGSAGAEMTYEAARAVRSIGGIELGLTSIDQLESRLGTLARERMPELARSKTCWLPIKSRLASIGRFEVDEADKSIVGIELAKRSAAGVPLCSSATNDRSELELGESRLPTTRAELARLFGSPGKDIGGGWWRYEAIGRRALTDREKANLSKVFGRDKVDADPLSVWVFRVEIRHESQQVANLRISFVESY